MTDSTQCLGLSRREALRLAAVAGVAVAASAPIRAFAAGADGMVGAIIGGRTPGEGLIALDLPGEPADGNAVPITVTVNSPMTRQDHVSALHLFADGNRTPQVAVFHFTPASGRARVETRIRLVQSQDIVAVAEMSDGSVQIARRRVEVAANASCDI